MRKRPSFTGYNTDDIGTNLEKFVQFYARIEEEKAFERFRNLYEEGIFGRLREEHVLVLQDMLANTSDKNEIKLCHRLLSFVEAN